MGKHWKLGRREFLAGGGSAALAGLLGGCGEETGGTGLSLGDGAPPAGHPDFKIGYQSYSLRHFPDPAEFLEQAARLGLPYIELYRGHLSTSSTVEEVVSLRDQLESIAVSVNAFGVETFTADHDQNQTLFRFGKALGVENLSASPTEDAFASLSRLVAQYDIRIAIHNHGPEDLQWQKPEWILEAVRDLDPRIGACVDTGHYIRAEVDPVEAVRLLGPRVLGVHLKDFNRDHKETVLGDGLLDLDATLEALRRVGFRGPLSIEYEQAGEDPIPAMLESVRRIREWESGA